MGRVLNRMGDVLLTLEQAERSRVKPTKIQLQKFIYLTDALMQIVGTPRPKNGHKTYKNGPYDPHIQNAVDALAFREVVRIAGVWPTPSGHLAVSYMLAPAGFVMLQKLHSSEDFSPRAKVAELIGAELRKAGRGWARIVDLVYAEPTYVNARPTGWGETLAVDNGLRASSAFLIAAMKRVIAAGNPESTVSDSWIANRFFAYLDDFDKHYSLRMKEIKNATVS